MNGAAALSGAPTAAPDADTDGKGSGKT